MDVSLRKLWGLVKDREAWCAADRGLTESDWAIEQQQRILEKKAPWAKEGACHLMVFFPLWIRRFIRRRELGMEASGLASSGSGPALFRDHVFSLVPLYSVQPRHRRKSLWLDIIYTDMQASQVPHSGEESPASARDTGLCWEDPLEKEMATHSSILAWRIPWTEEPGGLLSIGSQRVGHDWACSQWQKTF